MKNSHKVFEASVIIPTYNRSRLLSYTLDSLVNQNIDKDTFEVIIGDDGSSDDTREVVARYENLINVQYVFQDDLGYRPASARNNAVRLARGKLCLFIDSSVILAPDCISHHILFHKKRASSAAIGYVYGFDHDEESEDLLMKLVVPSDASNSIKRLAEYEVFHDIREKHYKKYQDRLEILPAPWYYFWTCHLSIATSDVINVGLFDERYDGRWGVEDNDLGFRLCQTGVRIFLLRDASSIHYPHGKNKIERQVEGYENCLQFHNKFQTVETKLFLDTYTNSGLIDINEISLGMSSKALSI